MMRLFKSKWFAEFARIDESDEQDFKTLAKILLTASDTELDNLVRHGKYLEITCDDRTQDIQK